MAKPIVLIGVCFDEIDQSESGELQKIESKLSDYHVLFVNEDVDYFKVFYEKDMTEVKFEELKAIVESCKSPTVTGGR